MIKQLLLLCIIFTLSYNVSSQIQVVNITSSSSSCVNNGTITIQATTANPPLLYSIVSGPTTQGVQTNPLFSSLPAGNYVIKLSDGIGTETTVPITISGNYLTPNFTATTIKPYCVGDSNGEITGIPLSGTGLAPFSWEIIAPSPVTFPSQGNSTFNNLPAGNYSVKMTDACGSYKTSVITLSDPNTTNPFYSGVGGIKIGCDSFNIHYRVYQNDARLPLTYKYETNSGTYTYTSATSFNTLGQFFTIDQVLPNVDYGDSVKIIVYNACGDSVFRTYYSSPYQFYPKYGFGACGTNPILSVENDPAAYFDTGLMSPLSYTVTNVSTSNVVDQGLVSNTAVTNGLSNLYGISTSAIQSGETYQVTITDGCGETFINNYTIPTQSPPKIISKQCCNYSCLDSVMGYQVITSGFTNGKLIITSGPATLGSTKPDFAYSDTYSYPITIPVSYNGYFNIQNLALGKYKFKIIDDCGYELFDSLIVNSTSKLTKEISYKKGCLGKNIIYFGAMQQAKITVKDLSTNTIIKTRVFSSNIPFYNRDSILNVPSGQYEIYIQYQPNSSVVGINDSLKSCWTIKDTILIEGYQTPEISTGNAIMCNNAVNFVLMPDSTKGVPPYQYEVISGPQLFPPQTSNVFTINAPGIYTARIYDNCGNASTKQITVDTLSFEPIEVSTTCADKKITFPPSLYFTYYWSLPNGQIFVGNELVISPVTSADTGVYHVSRIVNINGCTDTLTADFHVGLPNIYFQNIALCYGDTLTVGANQYIVPGVYTDSLLSVIGCDSILITTFTFLPQHSDTTHYTICPNDSVQVSGIYYSTPGFYVDSIQNTLGCYDLVVSHIINNNIASNVSVSICQGESYLFGSNSYTTSGIYTDTLLSSTTCDSIVTLNLIVLPLKTSSFTYSICQGDAYTFDGNSYTQSGTYTGTFPTATCDSIVTLNLTVLPLKTSSFTYSICQGDAYTFDGNSYTQSGTYTGTFPTATCDSIVTLILTVLPREYPIYDTICEGQEYLFEGSYYSEAGVYVKHYSTGNCDSIMKLYLEVVPNPSVMIISTKTELIEGFEVQLNAVSSSYPLIYWWQSDAVLSDNTIRNPTTSILNESWVTVTVTDKYGCSASDSKYIEIPPISTLYAPNTFTPDGDQYNNIFYFYGTNIADFHLLIFDRWGEIIFESYDINYGWDGTYKGRIVQDGVYVYKIEAKGMDNTIYEKTGHITVLK